jgi:fructose-specific PTS system IIB-like component
MNIVAVTACPSGVAHTYMAAEALQKAAEKRGHTIKVETQGSIGIENELVAKEIAAADAVILTNDMPITREERFKGKPVLRIGVSVAIKKAGQIIESLDAQLKPSGVTGP